MSSRQEKEPNNTEKLDEHSEADERKGRSRRIRARTNEKCRPQHQ